MESEAQALPKTMEIYDLLYPLVGILITWLSGVAASQIRARAKNEKLAGVLMRLNDSITTVVRSMNQTLVQEYRKAKVDGKLNKEEAEQIKGEALAEITELWGYKGMLEAQKVLGISEESLTKRIMHGIEVAVAESKPSLPLPLPEQLKAMVAANPLFPPAKRQ